MSAIKPICPPLECVVYDADLLRNIVLIHELEFSLVDTFDQKELTS